LPYRLFGPAISGGGAGTSILSATGRGFVVPGVEITGKVTADSSAAWQALRNSYGTASKAGIVGRTASRASIATGIGIDTCSDYKALSGPGK
jgi:hypothetical protein